MTWRLTIGISNPSRSRVPAGQAGEPLRDHFGRFPDDLAAAVAAERPANAGEEEAEVVVNLGRGADGAARIPDAVLLPDRDRRRDAVNRVDVGPLHPLEELPRVRRQRLDVPALPLGVDRVEGQRGLARPGHAGDDDQLARRQGDVHLLQVVGAGALDDDVADRRRSAGWTSISQHTVRVPGTGCRVPVRSRLDRAGPLRSARRPESATSARPACTSDCRQTFPK